MASEIASSDADALPEPPGYERSTSAHSRDTSRGSRHRSASKTAESMQLAVLRERMIFTLANLIGCVVEVTVGSNFFAAGGASQAAAGATSEEGEAGAFHVFRGVLYAAHTRKTCFGVILLYPRVICSCCKNTGYRGVSGQKPLIIYSRDLLELRKLDETFESTMSCGHLHFNFGSLNSTDVRHMHPQIPRDLKPWIAVQEAADAPQWDPRLDWSDDTLSHASSFSLGFDQFAVAASYGYHSTYQDDLYTTALDRSSEFYQLHSHEAEKLAREIANTPSKNCHVAEERGFHVTVNEEDRYSAVLSREPKQLGVPPRKRPKTSSQKRRKQSHDDSGFEGDISISESDQARTSASTARPASRPSAHPSAGPQNAIIGDKPEVFVFSSENGSDSTATLSNLDSGTPDPLLWFYVRLQEINEYALYLGMDPVYDSDLLWIAERALVAPLPESWTEHSDEQGHVFYYCGLTDTSSWEHPLDTLHRNLYLRLREERRSSQSAVHPEESAGAVQRKAQSESVNSSTLVPQDVLDMAAYLHLDLASEQALFWIARAAVLAPLPRNWTEQVDEVSNATVYVNEKGEIFSRHPADEYYLKLIEKARTLSGRAGEAPRASWQVFADANLELYYHNFTTGESTAARPVVSGLEAELLAREEEQILGAAKHLEGGPEQLANAEENAQEAAPKEKGMTVQQASAQHEQLMPSKKKKKTKDKEKASKTPASPSAPTFPISAIQEKPSKTPASASDSTFPVLAISEKSSKTPASTSALTSSTSFLVSVLPAGSAVALSLAAVVNQGRICIALALLAVFLTAMRSKS